MTNNSVFYELSSYKNELNNMNHSINENNINIENNDDNINIQNDFVLNKEENKYLDFKKKIMSDNTLDNQMKSILLQSRKEYLDSLRKKIIDKEISLTPELKIFMREYEKKCVLSKIYQNHKEVLIKKIKNYCEKKTKIILLEFEMCWDIYKLINNKIFDVDTKNKLLEIFKPADVEEYKNYVRIIEMSMKDYDKKQKKEKENKLMEKNKILKKEKEEKERIILEEKKKIEIIDRQKIISILDKYFKKLMLFDDEVNQIKTELDMSIKKYINFETEHIECDRNLHSRFNKFIDSVRISQEEKKIILKSINVN
jgi:hypothetical protein